MDVILTRPPQEGKRANDILSDDKIYSFPREPRSIINSNLSADDNILI